MRRITAADQMHLCTLNKKIQKKKQQRQRKKDKNCNLVSYEELSEYMKDNEYIHNYYRANWPLKQALFSIFRWHNETLNVWTHLIGFVVFVGLTFANLMHVPPPVADFLNIFTSWSFPSSNDTNVSLNLKNFFFDDVYMPNLDFLKENDDEVDLTCHTLFLLVHCYSFSFLMLVNKFCRYYGPCETKIQ